MTTIKRKRRPHGRKTQPQRIEALADAIHANADNIVIEDPDGRKLEVWGSVAGDLHTDNAVLTLYVKEVRP